MNRRDALRKTGLLAGAAATAPSLLALLQSCQAEPRLGWDPQFFTVDEARFVGAFVDALLPRTDTPGALDVKVDMFLDQLIAGVYDQQGQEAMRKEIADFNANCQAEYGQPFAELSAADQAAVLRAAEAAAPQFNGSVWGTTVGEQEPVGFYRSLKSTAVWAYRSSARIGTEVLDYDPVPGPYQGCIPAAEVRNSWSL